jgi:hypothetical protein
MVSADLGRDFGAVLRAVADAPGDWVAWSALADLYDEHGGAEAYGRAAECRHLAGLVRRRLVSPGALMAARIDTMTQACGVFDWQMERYEVAASALPPLGWAVRFGVPSVGWRRWLPALWPNDRGEPGRGEYVAWRAAVAGEGSVTVPGGGLVLWVEMRDGRRVLVVTIHPECPAAAECEPLPE